MSILTSAATYKLKRVLLPRLQLLLGDKFGLTGRLAQQEVHAEVDDLLLGGQPLLLDLGLGVRQEGLQRQRRVLEHGRRGGGRVVLVLVLHVHPHVLPHLALGAPPPEVSLLEVVHAGGVDGPVVPLAVSRPARLQEEVVEGEVVADRVPPALAAVPEVGEVVQHVLVDVRQHQLLLGVAEDGHGDQPDVGVLRLGLVREGDPEESGVELGHGEHGEVGRGAEPLVDDGEAGRGGAGARQEGGQRVAEVEVRERGQQPHPVRQREVVQLREVEAVPGSGGRGGGGGRAGGGEHGEGEGGGEGGGGAGGEAGGRGGARGLRLGDVELRGQQDPVAGAGGRVLQQGQVSGVTVINRQ